MKSDSDFLKELLERSNEMPFLVIRGEAKKWK
jgi:hypothetical protein